MRPVLNGRSTFYRNPVIGTYTENEGYYKGRQFMNGVFGRMPTDMFKAANLNLTFQDYVTTVGNSDSNGTFDGVYGILQRNESDFSAMPLAIEALRGPFDSPFKIIALASETEYRTVTNPTYNPVVIEFDIEDSITVIHFSTVIVYLLLFLMIRIEIAHVGYLLLKHWQPEQRRKRERRKTNGHVTWNLFRLLFNQASKNEFESTTQTVLFRIFECSMAILTVLYYNHVSANLVSYNKPDLINTLQDLWKAGDSVKVTFTEAVNVADIFKSLPKESMEHKLYDRSIAQWAFAEGTDEHFHLLPSDSMLKVPDLIKKYKMALLATTVPIGMIMGLECKDLFHDDAPPLRSSWLHISKESYMKENSAILASLSIRPELEARLVTFFRRIMDAGFNERTFNRGAMMTMDSLPFPKPVPEECLNTKAWDVHDSDGNPVSFGLKGCKRFLLHITLAFIPCIITLITEMTTGKVVKHSKWKSTVKSEKLKQKILKEELKKITLTIQNAPRPLVISSPNERLMKIRNRRLALIAEAKEIQKRKSIALEQNVI